jgi:hypothetical protein
MDLFTVCITARAEEIETARPLCLAWMDSQGRHAQTAEKMLPTPLSPTGELPATHHLCAMGLTQARHDHMQAFIVANQVPVTAELVGPQAADSHEATLANREPWLAAKNLKVIEAV